MTAQSQLGSVLMPVYDGDEPRHLRTAIESILSQTYTNLEFLIIQDGVTRPEILEVIREYQEKHPMIRCVATARQSGIVAALNLGLDHAQGDYIIRMDADDVSNPRRVEKQIAFLQSRPDLEFVSTFQYLISDDGKVLGEYVMPLSWEEAVKVMPWKVPFGHANAVFRRSFFERMGKYRDVLKNQDTDLWFRAYLAGIKGANIPEHLYLVRRSKNWITRKRSLEIALTDLRIRRYYIPKGNFPWYACFAPYVYFAIKLIPPRIFDRLYIPLHSLFIAIFKTQYRAPADR